TPLDRLTAALASHYRIERELGQGGMATVYLAEDLKHHRKVAVKVLRPELAATMGPERFSREIEIAANLQHPHVLAVHDSGEADGFLYYVMPYVEGDSLRDRLRKQGELPIPDAVRILVEVVDALAHAHTKGVVHRDIKPENIMLSGRHALVTDFGVAKAVSEATGRNQLTTAGVALGTPAYMAPEQAAAEPNLDHRVDIYAIGALGYELISGRPPFSGGAQEILAAHVTKTPEPLISRRTNCPPALNAVIMKCLEKRPSDRWQSADELVAALEPLATTSGGLTPTHTRPVPGIRRQAETGRAGLIKWVVAAAVLIALAALVLSRRGGSDVVLGTQSRITDSPGLETDPAISPDHRFIAFAAGPYFESHIFVRQLSGGPVRDLTASLAGRHTWPRWSPDGSELLYVSSDGRHRRVSRVSLLGGAPKTVIDVEGDDGIAGADWSPDGKRIVYDLGGSLYLIPLDGGSASVLWQGTDPFAMSWSPDGKHIAFVEGGNRLWHGATDLTNVAPSAILVISADGQQTDTIAPRTSINLTPTWTPDSRGLFFISSRDGSKDIYRASLTSKGALSGTPERLTTGLTAHALSLAKDGRTLAVSTLVRQANIWMLPLQLGRTIDDDGATQVTRGQQVIERVFGTADGKWLIYDSDRPGNQDIYRVRIDQSGLDAEQLTTDSAGDYAASASPDGKEILFHSFRLGNRDLFLMSSDGTNQRPLTTTARDEFAGMWSPDGRAISYYADSAAALWLGIMSRDSSGKWGVGRLILRDVPGITGWSPDGKRVLGTHEGRLQDIDVATGKATPFDPDVPTSQGLRYGLWAADGKGFYYRTRESDGRLTLFYQSLATHARQVLVRAKDASRSALRADWWTDGKRFVYTITQYEGDVSTIEVREK
ncbi:MAG: protein kinase, partial [Gemmatimonadota bacterium]